MMMQGDGEYHGSMSPLEQSLANILMCPNVIILVIEKLKKKMLGISICLQVERHSWTKFVIVIDNFVISDNLLVRRTIFGTE